MNIDAARVLHAISGDSQTEGQVAAATGLNKLKVRAIFSDLSQAGLAEVEHHIQMGSLKIEHWQLKKLVQQQAAA